MIGRKREEAWGSRTGSTGSGAATPDFTDFDEMMNPLVSARLQHFVCINDAPDRPYLGHYFQFLNKAGLREEFIVFYGNTIGGYTYECTAYRKQGEDAYSLLNDRSP
jgi:hypothetical protein